MRHARLIEAGAGKYWMWMSNVCYGPAGYRALSVAEAVERKSSPVGRTVWWAKGPGETQGPFQARLKAGGATWTGLPIVLGAPVSPGDGGVGAEAAAGADPSAFLAEPFAAPVGSESRAQAGAGWGNRSERAGCHRSGVRCISQMAWLISPITSVSFLSLSL